MSLLKPFIDRMPISEIEPADVLGAISKIEKKDNLESARRSPQLASAVFRHAVATARLGSDSTRDLRGALTAPTVTHFLSTKARCDCPAYWWYTVAGGRLWRFKHGR